jgi:hypothetical protein
LDNIPAQAPAYAGQAPQGYIQAPGYPTQPQQGFSPYPSGPGPMPFVPPNKPNFGN